MTNKRNYSNIIKRLEAKRDATEFKGERDELDRKIKELREKHPEADFTPFTVRTINEQEAEEFVNRMNPWNFPPPKTSTDQAEWVWHGDVKSAYPEDIVEEDYQYDNEQSDW